MANDVTIYLKYANLQMAAESLFGVLRSSAAGTIADAGFMTEVGLTLGNS